MLEETRQLEALLRAKAIPAWVDYWGQDVNHDWPWWRKQIVYFLDNILYA
jgi:esterase/lipase superfamily enzyme